MLVANLKPLYWAIERAMVREMLTTSTFIQSILEFIFIATSHKHCAFTIAYDRFGKLGLFASYTIVMRLRNLKTAANKIKRRQLALSGVSLGVLQHETAVHGC